MAKPMAKLSVSGGVSAKLTVRDGPDASLSVKDAGTSKLTVGDTGKTSLSLRDVPASKLSVNGVVVSEGTTDYELLKRKPRIEDVELIGNRELEEFGMGLASDYDILMLFK